MSPDTTVTVLLLVGSIGWVLATIGLCALEARREERRAAMRRHPAGRGR